MINSDCLEQTNSLWAFQIFSDILKVNGGLQKLQLNSLGMDDYRSSNYMLCGTASKPQGCDWKVLRRRTIKKTLGFKREDG